MSFFKDVTSTQPDHVSLTKATIAVLQSDVEFGSVITVQPGGRVNIGILIGSQVSDIMSAAGFSAAFSAPNSRMSGTITLQRRMKEEDASYHWRDVQSWSVTLAQGEGASSENITSYPEPELAEYRIGIKTGDYESGVGLARIGTI